MWRFQLKPKKDPRLFLVGACAYSKAPPFLPCSERVYAWLMCSGFVAGRGPAGKFACCAIAHRPVHKRLFSFVQLQACWGRAQAGVVCLKHVSRTFCSRHILRLTTWQLPSDRARLPVISSGCESHRVRKTGSCRGQLIESQPEYAHSSSGAGWPHGLT